MTIFWLLVAALIALGGVVIAVCLSIIGFKLNYHLNRNGLAIQWGVCRQRIPLNHIEAIIPGDVLEEPIQFKGFNFAGLRIGWGQTEESERITFRTTAPLEKSLLIVTPKKIYVISPQDRQAFLQAWQDRQTLGPTQQWQEEVRRGWPLTIGMLSDPLSWWLIGVAALICLALLGYVSIRYTNLPPSLPIHFNNFGQADRITDKINLFTLPAVGGIALGINIILGGLIHHREKVAAYMLLGSTVTVQIFLWIAMLTITI
ncbi:MAG: DUF1648 domain-containing protein [Anaerolineae bacterium]|nr:DUF1648 domain-containing protein [Anaerolineae bacterium]